MTRRRRLPILGLLLAGLLLPLAAAVPAEAADGRVRIEGSEGRRGLVVDGRPWQVRGVTWGPPQAEADRWLPDVEALGANTVRTWGVDDGTPVLLRAAARRGMRVVVGHWLGHDVDWVHDAAERVRLRKEVLARVRALRDEPGVLMWGIGNEVMLEQGARGTTAGAQRIAYARFVDSLARAIHRVDPDHPVLSTEAVPAHWRLLARYAPHLDAIGVNAYRSIGVVDRVFRAAHIPQPYLVTETGPPGDWEEPADPLGGPRDDGDRARAAAVTAAIRAATAHPGRSLGVTVFHYGTESDVPGIRYGLRTLGLRRLAWYAVQRAFAGRATQAAPVISRFAVARRTVRAGGTVRLRAAATDADGDRVRFRVLATAEPDLRSTALRAVRTRVVRPGVLAVRAPSTPGVHRLVLVARDGNGAAGMQSVTVEVLPAR